MAVMHSTTMNPGKLEILAQWLPRQPWFHGNPRELKRVGSYRLDDPAGEVGLEGILLTAGGDDVYHVPLSYRGAPLVDGEDFLAATAEHGVLGTRWISDASGDPVFRAVLATTIAQGGHEALEFVQGADGALVPRTILTRVAGSGGGSTPVPDFSRARVDELDGATRLMTDTAELRIIRVLPVSGAGEESEFASGFEVLRGTWTEQMAPVVLAAMRGV